MQEDTGPCCWRGTKIITKINVMILTAGVTSLAQSYQGKYHIYWTARL